MKFQWCLCLGFILACHGNAGEGKWVDQTNLKSAEIIQPLPASKEVPGKEISLNHSSLTQSVEVQVSSKEETPRQVIERYTQKLRDMLHISSRKDKGKEDKNLEKKVTQTVREFFDFETLAKLSLGDTWGKIQSSQQKEFSNLFVTLVETNYIRRSRDLVGDYQLSFGEENTQTDKAKVICKVARDDADVTITYELHRRPKQSKSWMIYNIVLDNVDLVRNYQSQFNSFIFKYGRSQKDINKGFNDLLSKMRKKKTSDDPLV